MRRSRTEWAVSLVLGLLALLTAVWPQWIEAASGSAPDGGDGSLEWAIVLALASAALVAALMARRSMRLARASLGS